MLILKLSWWYDLLLCPVHVGSIYTSQLGVEDFAWLSSIIGLLFFPWCSISVVLGLHVLAWWFLYPVAFCVSICVRWLERSRDVDDLDPTVSNSLHCVWSCCASCYDVSPLLLMYQWWISVVLYIYIYIYITWLQWQATSKHSITNILTYHLCVFYN
jgi:hypothetical protein